MAIMSPSTISNTLPHCFVQQDLDSKTQTQTKFDIDFDSGCCHHSTLIVLFVYICCTLYMSPLYVNYTPYPHISLLLHYLSLYHCTLSSNTPCHMHLVYVGFKEGAGHCPCHTWAWPHILGGQGQAWTWCQCQGQ